MANRLIRISLLLFSFGMFPLGSAIAQSQLPTASQQQNPHDAAEPASPSDNQRSIYSNPLFGLSIQIPEAYTLILGQGAGARPSDFNFLPEDAGEYLFAKIEITNSTFPYPIIAPSSAALYLGVHLGVSQEECAEPLDFPRYKSRGTDRIDGVNFRWGNGPPDLPARTRAFVPSGARYYRDYAGFANSVCYRFHLRATPIPKQNPVSALEAIVSSVKIFPGTAAPVAPGELETPFQLPDEVREILKLVPWRVSYPRTGISVLHRSEPQPEFFEDNNQGLVRRRSNPLPSNSVFNAITLTYASELQDGPAATAVIAKLQQEVVHILEQHQWALSSGTPAPGASLTYQRGDAIVNLSEGTSRCTMNSPCTDFDSLTVTANIPIALN
jgi:hypothetical protein